MFVENLHFSMTLSKRESGSSHLTANSNIGGMSARWTISPADEGRVVIVLNRPTSFQHHVHPADRGVYRHDADARNLALITVKRILCRLGDVHAFDPCKVDN